MRGVVLDASAVADAALGASGLPREIFHSHIGLDIEVMSVFRRQVIHGMVSAHEAREAIDVFLSIEIASHPVRRLLPRIWSLRHDISSYDAGYVALAESLGIPLVTRDKKLAKTAQRYCDVIVP